MYHAVVNLDDGSIVTVEPSAQSAQETMYALMNSQGVRNMMVLPIETSVWLAYSEGGELEFDINDSDDSDGLLVPVIRVVQPV